ncbi:excinuclease ABC subunit B [uncultured Brachyspira sp.]|uniref:excinuclease ABC subunit B n=1 Tax=uncultured Brachyspira sp. TaxID=221953 RepID=UPI0027DCC0F4|nr:excinuclease ABC subunit B [uncultured Brachyspira sp.]
MNCNICGKEKAVLHIVETIDEKRDKISVCKKCSKDFGIIEKCFESFEDNNNLISIFPNHKSTKLKKIKANKKNRKETCNACGYSLNDFLKTKTVVCPKCYNSFEAFVKKIVYRIHNENKHIGNMPSKKLSEVDIEKEILKHQSDIEILKSMEKYEEANELKKKIETLSEVLISKKI